MPDAVRPSILGLHHAKLPVSDLDRSLAFYEAVFGASRIAAADHRHTGTGALYAYILKIPGLEGMVELRLNPEQAARHKSFDPLTFAVADLTALMQWSAHLDAVAAPHSPVIAGVQSWMIIVEDPDGIRLRLYSLAGHGPDILPDETNPWVL